MVKINLHFTQKHTVIMPREKQCDLNLVSVGTNGSGDVGSGKGCSSTLKIF